MPRIHKSLPRLYVEPALASGQQLALQREQINYLVSVLRRRPGDEVIVFNGRDGAWLATLVDAGRKAAALEIGPQTAPQTQASDLWYGFAPLKTGRLDYMVQKATEMGAGVLQPVLTRFTQVSRLKSEKLRANVIEAAEQCEVLNIPVIAPAIGLEALLSTWRTHHGLRRLVVCDESAQSASPLEQLHDLDGLPVGVLVGPEGGFSEDERARMLSEDFIIPVSLGPRILRADTAAVAALALVQATIGDWR